MAKARNTKPAVDPIFAVVEAHRRELAIYEPIARKLNNAARDGLPDDALEEEHDAAAEEMCPLHKALHDAMPATAAGRRALRAYMKEVDANDILEKKWTLGRAETGRIRARLMLLAHEQPSILLEEINEAMKGDRKLDDFCDRHEVSMDWLLGCNVGLKMLLVMTQEYRRSRSFAAIKGG